MIKLSQLIFLISVIFILLVGMAMTGCTTTDYAIYAKLYTEEKGQHDEAIKNAKQGIAIDPNYARNWYWLGVAYARKGNYDEAIPAFKKVIELKPTDVQYQSSYDFLGWAYYLNGDYDEAINYFAESLKLSPKDTSSLTGIGWSYFWKADYDAALKYFNETVKIVYNENTLMARAWAYLSKGMINEAFGDAIGAISLNPQKEGGYRIRGWVHYFRGNYKEALHELNLSIERIINDSLAPMARQHAIRGKAFSYLGLGDISTALSLVKSANDALKYDVNHDISLIYFVAGDKDRAWEYRGGKGFIGAEIKDYKKGTVGGIEVVRTKAGSPAEKAGMLTGDIILKLNDADITGMMDFINKEKILIPGTIAKVKILREGMEKDLSLSVMSAEALMENDHLIASIIAKKTGEPETVVKLPQEVSPVIKPDVYELLPAEKLPPLRSDTYAVIIGIDYKGRADIPNLQYPSQDAKKVYDILTDARYGGIPKENTMLLLNEKATRNEMIAALRKIKTWDGYVYVYYSGHGAPKTKEDKFIDGFLVPNDVVITDPEAMEETSIKISYLQELVDSSQAKGVMVALDACFSGGGKSIVPKGGKPLVGMLVSPELIKPKGAGKVMITSSATNQQSWEDEKELKSGIFSHYLIEGLKGKAGKDVWVKVDELADYIKENVSKAARKLKGQEQNPQISGKGDFAVTRNWEKAKVMDIDIARNKLKAAFEKGDIRAEQLKKAMNELKTQTRSKTLEAFLEGKINEKEFGELY